MASLLTHDFDELAKRLAPHYKQFKVSERLLFTGHSHQAWPDVAFEGQKEAFLTAATLIDDKWQVAFERVEKLRDYLRKYYEDDTGYYAFAPNTHELLIRWLSSLPMSDKKRHIITTTGEFYSVRRQLLRLQEEGMAVSFVSHHPREGLLTRIQQACSEKTMAVICSHVFFDSGCVNPVLSELAAWGRQQNIPLLIDDYHGTNVVPLRIPPLLRDNTFWLGGGYKYLQWGEGNCFLRFPKCCRWRPIVTGWFADFESLHKEPYTLRYPVDEQRFAGATYDPTAAFRAAKVVDFFWEQALSPRRLRQQYFLQVSYLKACFEALNIPPHRIQLKHKGSLNEHGGFLAFSCKQSALITKKLREKNVWVDHRGNTLRFGLAPYVQKIQIEEAMQRLRDVIDAC